MTNYNDGKWHGWNGGSCPVHTQSQVEYVWGRGTHSSLYRETAGVLEWEGNMHGNIIAFRVTKEYKEPAQCWVNVYPNSGVGAYIYYTKEEALRGALCGARQTLFREVIE